MLLAFFLIDNDVSARSLSLQHISCTASSSGVQRHHRATRPRARTGDVANTATACVVLCQFRRAISLESGSEENVTHHPFGRSVIPYDTLLIGRFRNEIFVHGRNGGVVGELRRVTGWRAYIAGTASSDRVNLRQQ